MAEPIFESGVWIYKMFVTLIVAIIAIGIFAVSIKQDLNTIDIQGNLLLNRILYSPDGFWYQEDGVTYPGIIDMTKFSQPTMQSTLDSNFKYPSGYGGASITLISGGKSTSLFINKPTYKDINVQVGAGTANAGSVQTHRYPVVVRSDIGDEQGVLVVSIALPVTT